MHHCLRAFWSFCGFWVLFTLGAQPASAGTDPFSVVASPTVLEVGKEGALSVSFRVPSGSILYADAMDVRVQQQSGLSFGALKKPEPEWKMDPAQGVIRAVYTHDVTWVLPVTAKKPGSHQPVLEAQWQGCKGTLCTMLQTRSLPVDVQVRAASGMRYSPHPLLALLVGPAHAAEETAPEPVKVAVRVEPGRLLVDFDQQDGWHLTEMMTYIELEKDQAVSAGEEGWPTAHQRPDPALEGMTRGEYDGDFTVPVALVGPEGTHKVKGVVGYQACRAERCLLPQTYEFEREVVLGVASSTEAQVASTDEPKDAAKSAESSSSESTVVDAEPTSAFDKAREKGILWLLFFVFAAGFLVSLTPCVLPMVPITMGIIGAAADGSRKKGLALGASYVLGQALVYTALGVSAAMAGSVFGAWMQSPWVVGGVAGFFVVMGFSMFGFFNVQVPATLQTKLSNVGGAGFVGAFLVGMVGALVAGPCSGPVIASLMVLIGQQGEMFLGISLMLAFSLGMGVIFLVAGAFSTSVLRPGAWMDTVKKAFGVMLWLGAIYFASAHLSQTTMAFLTMFVLLSTAVWGWPSRTEDDLSNVVKLKRLYSVVAGILGVYLLLGLLMTRGFILPPVEFAASSAVEKPKMAWQKDEEAVFAAAENSGKPVIVDFTAKWCAPCKKLDKKTFSNAEVIALSESFELLKVDGTKSSKRLTRLKDRFNVQGFPTVAFVRADGTTMDAHKLEKFEGPGAFLKRMQGVLDALSKEEQR